LVDGPVGPSGRCSQCLVNIDAYVGYFIGFAEFFARVFGCEHPVDPSAFGIAALLPSGDLGDDDVLVVDATVENPAAQNAVFDLTMFSQLACLGV
jgi:hypothetical protein